MAVDGDTIYVLMQDPEYDSHWIVLGVFASKAAAERSLEILERASARGDLKIEPHALRA